MKKTMIIIFTIMMLFTSTQSYADTNFSDLSDSHWAYGYVRVLSEEGIIKGYPDGTFRPSDNVRVDEFIAMAMRAGGHQLESKSSHWARPYIDKAIELRIIEDLEFPSYTALITRQEMLSIAVNVLSMSEPRIGNQMDPYVRTAIKDYHLIDDYYRQNVLEGYKFGLVSGYPDGTFKPSNKAMRSEASVILSTMIDQDLRKPYENEEVLSYPVPHIRWYDADGNRVPIERVNTRIHTRVMEGVTMYAPLWNGKPVNEIVHFAELLDQIKEGDKGFLDYAGNATNHYYRVNAYENKKMYDEMMATESDLQRSFLTAEKMDFNLAVESLNFSQKHSPYDLVLWKRHHHAEAHGFASLDAYIEATYGDQLKAMFDFWFEGQSKEVWNWFISAVDYRGSLDTREGVVNGRYVWIQMTPNTVRLTVSLQGYE